jgi:hypothetical protein
LARSRALHLRHDLHGVGDAQVADRVGVLVDMRVL